MFFQYFQLTMHVFASPFYRLCQIFKQLRLNFILDFLKLKHSLFCLRYIEWYCISWVLVALWNAVIKYVLWRLDKKWYDRFFCYLKSYNIPSVFSINTWPSIIEQGLVYIYCKYVSYLPLLVKIFRCNLYMTTFKTRQLYYMFLNPSYNFLSKHIR